MSSVDLGGRRIVKKRTTTRKRNPGTMKSRVSAACARSGPAAAAGIRAGDVIVVCGGVIPPQDYNYLKQHCIRAIFGPGTNIPRAAREIMGLIRHVKG